MTDNNPPRPKGQLSRQLIWLLLIWAFNYLTTAFFFIERDLLQGLAWAVSLWAALGMTHSFMRMLDMTQGMANDMLQMIWEAKEQHLNRQSKETQP